MFLSIKLVRLQLLPQLNEVDFRFRIWHSSLAY